MSRLLQSAIAVVTLWAVWSCDLTGGGGGGGGTGGGTATSFSSGFATVRKDDRNLFVTDERDVNAPVQLTSTGGVSMPSFPTPTDGHSCILPSRETSPPWSRC